MPTNRAIDDHLLTSAQKISGFKTLKETVNQALREFIQRRKQQGILDLFGTVEYDRDYGCKKLRNRK